MRWLAASQFPPQSAVPRLLPGLQPTSRLIPEVYKAFEVVGIKGQLPLDGCLQLSPSDQRYSIGTKVTPIRRPVGLEACSR